MMQKALHSYPFALYFPADVEILRCKNAFQALQFPQYIVYRLAICVETSAYKRIIPPERFQKHFDMNGQPGL